MNTRGVVGYTYRDFCDYARRFDQVALLTGIARTALELPDHPSEDPASYLRTPPWALAAMARASICHGNRHRSIPVGSDGIPLGCHMYFNIKPQEMSDPALSPAFNTWLRIAYEQFPYQERPSAELARVEPFFADYSGRKPLEVLDEAGVTALLGAPVRQAVGVAILLHAIAQERGGFFDPAWLNGSDVLDTLPLQDIQTVMDACFAISFDGFRKLADTAPVLPSLERYTFNPLTARPFLRLDDGRLLAPVPQLIARRLSPIELYYQGLGRFGLPYARDMGELLEDYVGRQLHTLPDADVHSEIEYGPKKAKTRSIDWIVVFPDAVLLVEVKAARLAAPARSGADTAQESVCKTLAEAFGQIDRTRQAIADGVPGFASIPTDRPFLGLVAALDPWYMSNSTATRALLPQPAVPTVVASLPELETLVAIGQRLRASEVLQRITDDPEMRASMLGSALNRFAEPGDENPILQAAWQRYPFSGPEPAADAPR